MSDSQQSSIKFSLEESVLFKNGQEVDELISISLDPDISILEEDSFVMLRGSLNLAGEYKRTVSEEEPSEDDAPKGRYVQQVEDRDDGECGFLHQFPVDITIPKDRVPSSDDIFVEVQSFDYHLPESSRLMIEADVHIYGLQGEEEEQDTQDTEERDHEELGAVEKSEEAPILAEQRNEAEDEGESTVEVELEEYKEEPIQELVERHGEKENEDDLYTAFSAEARASQEKGSKGEHPFQSMPFPNLPEIDMNEVADRLKGFFQKAVMESPSASSHSPSADKAVAESSSHASSSKEKESSEVKPKKKKGKYHSMSFADFFARKEDEISAKLKVRLVQDGDSLDGIADKYGVSVQQILRANQLDPGQEVYEGQVLYIPEKAAYRK
ncbi:stage VI sporulation protein D [Siminovitchia sediminis]|uniref:Stage VI sporulation protein D n=1 Tax=Siminovitchia sediminis TaxID=1274353 RepID=A0ABW4KBP0_9BACI